jgi:hypothetical protein
MQASLPLFGQESKPNSPVFSSKGGLGITPYDSTFSLKFNFIMQNRFELTNSDGEFSKFVPRVRRMRFKFSGFLLDPRLTYKFQIGFSPSDIATSIKGDTPNGLLDAIVDYKFSKKFSMSFGQTILPSNKQMITSSGKLQFVDRSIINKLFTLDRDYGLFAKYSSDFGGDFHYNIRAAITSGEGRNYIKNTVDGLSYTGRLELLPFGKFSGKGDQFEGDLEREETPKLALGAGYSFNDNAVRLHGQTGPMLYDVKDITNTYLDAIFKSNGFAISTELNQRHTDDPLSVSSDEDTIAVFDGLGWNYQMSYTFENNFEIAGKYSLVDPSDKVNEQYPQLSEIAVGVSKYLKGHTIKLQSDLGYYVSKHEITEAKSEDWLFRFQLTVGI